jgi:hypothetical protein
LIPKFLGSTGERQRYAQARRGCLHDLPLSEAVLLAPVASVAAQDAGAEQATPSHSRSDWAVAAATWGSGDMGMAMASFMGRTMSCPEGEGNRTFGRWGRGC